ncbi:DUF2285 domain-containing protein [Agrobacterium tumefaciens]|uniref:DUF2285 domain-containing protein n=1 Tax=Agrobacterium tumefaciens TaxID=358 RepID=A0AA44F9T3_AGRTU|nr:DUF2285 domain-containing protein [Agrobacterium tumefaciens]NTB87892.1 DUF2285 domain-containing protein [Agrobacterium tumefaciens]NTC20102.1 DUF2285 domain-containing protein [Agrobacterium tumefaciens]NTC31139.1 DUF2285 domain-containing protein [Agrobacterium tumefaciens]
MTAKNLYEAEPAAFDHVIVEARRGAHGRYWTRIRSGLIVVSDDELTAERPRSFIVPWSPDWSIRIATAERLRRVWGGQTPRALFTLQRRKRIGHALRTDDARQSGAKLRDIAITYFGARRVADEPWKTSALKAQIARLANYGRHLTETGFKQLLRGKTK